MHHPHPHHLQQQQQQQPMEEQQQQQQSGAMLLASVASSSNSLRRSTMTCPSTNVQNEQQPPPFKTMYNVPSFYGVQQQQRDSPMSNTMIRQSSSDTVSSITAAGGGGGGENSKSTNLLILPPISEASMTCMAEGAEVSESSTSIQFRDKCISFLAMLAALAALTCAAVAMAGTASWVDTWEPIDLPPVEEWPTLFGTGYGNFLGNGGSGGVGGGGGKLSKSKSGSGLFYHVTSQPPPPGGNALPQPPNYHDSYWLTPDPVTTSTTATTSTTTITASSSGRPSATTTKTAVDDDLLTSDEDDYYADDEPIKSNGPRVSMMIEVMKNQQQQYEGNMDNSGASGLKTTTEEWENESRRINLMEASAADDPQSAGRYSGSLVVVFHVGLFRACPVLKGELPANIVLPNLPCVFLDYSPTWQRLTGQSFRLWTNVQFTPDLLNKIRFATPCILLGSLLSLTALVTTAFGRCTTPDRSLIAATLHILAGLSLGSALIVFVSVLHDEFTLPPTMRSAASNYRYGGVGSDGSVAFYSDSRTQQQQQQQQQSSGINSFPSPPLTSSIPAAALIPSYRYDWAFYAALASFACSQVAAGLYIVLHTHLFKLRRRQRASLAISKTVSLITANSGHRREVAVQTVPLSSVSLLTMMDNNSSSGNGNLQAMNHHHIAVLSSPDIHLQQPQQPPQQQQQHQVVNNYCDLLMPNQVDGGSGPTSSAVENSRPSPTYINDEQRQIDCNCQVHYATYRPPATKRNHPAIQANHVAGIHGMGKSSTMPRKVSFAGVEVNHSYQQTPL